MPGCFARTCQEHLVEEPVGLVEVEYQIELAHVAKVLVEHFDKVVDHVQSDELVVARVDRAHKVEARVALVHHLEVAPVQEVAQLRAQQLLVEAFAPCMHKR